jgi:hypothetical protein
MKVIFKIPTELNDIPLRQYQEFQKIIDANKGNEDSTHVQIKMLEIFCGADINVMRQCDINKFDAAVLALKKVMDQKHIHSRIINVNGREFGFIPKLEDMTMGEYVDLESSLSDPQLFHKAMAVMYRPIKMKVKDTYLIEAYKADEDLADTMKDAGLQDVFGAMVFFWNLGSALVANIIHSLKEEYQMNTEAGRNSQSDGVGINPLITSLETMLQSSKELQNSLLSSVSLN